MFDLMVRKNGFDWDQWDEFNRIDNVLERLIGPGSNVYKFDYGVSDHIDDEHIQISVPGLTKDDLRVILKDRTITVSYTVEEKKNSKNTKLHFVKSFIKSYHIKDDVDVDKISVECKDGVLHIHLPRHTSSKERLIEVK